MIAKEILSIMVILAIACSLGQAANSCLCIDNGANAVASATVDFTNYAYANPPSGVPSYPGGGTTYYFATGSATGRIFFNYDGAALSGTSSYIAIGCPLYTGNANLCSNGPYGFADAAACSSCGTCCCVGNTANGVCVPQTSSGD